MIEQKGNPKKLSLFLVFGAAIGTALGVSACAAFNNLVMFTGLGTALGAGIGLLIAVGLLRKDTRDSH